MQSLNIQLDGQAVESFKVKGCLPKTLHKQTVLLYLTFF